MAWGKQKVQAPPSTIRQLLPLIVTLAILGVVAWVCYQIYLSLGKIQDQAKRQMGGNVSFTKDGMRVNVKNIENESYMDRTQSWFVKAWELGSTSSTSGSSGGQGDAERRKRNVLTKPKPGESQHG